MIHTDGTGTMELNRKFMSKGYIPPEFTESISEYDSTDKEISVVGRLAKHVGFWKQIGAPHYILDTIQRGYHLPLSEQPKPNHLRNNASSRNNPEFVRKSLDDLLVSGAIVEVDKPPPVINPLTVSTKHGMERLVLDLRYINRYVHTNPCKIGAETLQKYLPGATHLFGFDLKAGYHHVDVHASQWELLGFSYPDYRGKDRFFMFKVLPFGLSSAGFVFTKLLRVLIRHWRGQCIKVVAFFDDGLGAGHSVQEALLHSNIVHTDLIRAIWNPSSVLTWLGFLYDLVQKIVKATPGKIARTIAIVDEILDMQLVSVRRLSAAIGSITALYLAFGDIVYLKTKASQMIVAEDKDWSREVVISPASRDELKFWRAYLSSQNGMKIQHPVAAGARTYSDASETGCAAVVTPLPDRREYIVHKQFGSTEVGTSSTFRELVAVKHGIQQAKSLLQDKCVRWYTDSANVVSIIRKRSMVPDLQNITLEIFTITRQYNIQLAMTWVSLDYNLRADMCSRIIAYDDWGIHPKWYAYIVAKLGVPQFD